MLYSDAALFRIRRWYENLGPQPGLLRLIADRAGLSERAVSRAMREGTYPNVSTLRRIERLVPADFMPLRLDGVMTNAGQDEAEPEPATTP